MSKQSEKLFEALGKIDDRYIEEAEETTLTARRGLPPLWKALLPAAACLALAAALFPRTTDPLADLPPIDPDLPKLTIDTENFYGGGMGFEGYMAYDISDLASANPWIEEEAPTTLPVFQNPVNYLPSGLALDLSVQEMESLGREVASRLDADVLQVTVRPTQEEVLKIREKYAQIGQEPPEHSLVPSQVEIHSEKGTIDVYGDGTMCIHYEPAIRLPEGYHFTYTSTREELEAVGQYLLEEFDGLLAMEEPILCIEGGDFNIYGEQSFSLRFYEGKGDSTQRLLNYHFSGITFSGNEEGELWISWLNTQDLSQKIGDYPILTLQQAQAMLVQGRYLTTVPEEFPGEKQIRKAKLVYRSGHEATLLPYYRFYVELPSMKQENDLNTYGAYYVPAIPEGYLTNLEIWDGSFN